MSTALNRARSFIEETGMAPPAMDGWPRQSTRHELAEPFRTRR
jgi:hypothetical protein